MGLWFLNMVFMGFWFVSMVCMGFWFVFMGFWFVNMVVMGFWFVNMVQSFKSTAERQAQENDSFARPLRSLGILATSRPQEAQIPVKSYDLQPTNLHPKNPKP